MVKGCFTELINATYAVLLLTLVLSIKTYYYECRTAPLIKSVNLLLHPDISNIMFYYKEVKQKFSEVISHFKLKIWRESVSFSKHSTVCTAEIKLNKPLN